DGTADSISAYIEGRSLDEFKCAIYRKSDNRLVGATEIIKLDATFTGWKTFNFGEPRPSLSAGTDYCLVCWGKFSTQFLYGDPEIDRGVFQRITYGPWPDPWSPGLTNLKCSIYCTYSPVAPPPTRKLRIESEPISVPVTLDGAPIGNTPVEADVEEGTHEVGVPEEATAP
ncbi:unnamed protein product, partial [marine sediment metagenome]